MDEKLLKPKMEGDEKEVEEEEALTEAMPSEPVITGGEGEGQAQMAEIENEGEGQPTTPTEPTETSAEETGPAETEPEPQVPVQEEATEPSPDAQQVLPQSPAQPEIVEENGAMETSIKTFTQDEVNKIVGDTRMRTREKTMAAVYGRYGVKNEEELDQMYANAQRFETQKEQYDAEKSAWETERSDAEKRLGEMSEEIALMKSGIKPEKYEDAKLIIKGKGQEVTAEAIAQELASHPEWNKEEPKKEETPEMVKPAETTRIKTLGNEPKPAAPESELEQAQKLFKMNFHG